MKNIIKSVGLCLGLSVCFQACDDWTIPENEVIQNLEGTQKSEEYYENLRAYKKSDHQLAFGWFGFWNGGTGTSARGSLRSVPDSVDLIAIWGNNWHYGEMNEQRRNDLKFVQEKYGTKVVGTVLLGAKGQYLPEGWEPEGETEREKWSSYGRALAQMTIDAGLDGLDIDYEPGIGGAPTYGCPQGDNFLAFVEGCAELLGPKSGTGRLLIVDGLFSFPKESDQYFDYFISQAYGTARFSSLESRFKSLRSRIKPEQFIVTENFESFWKNGGVKFDHPELGSIPSLLGMAYWVPEDCIRKGGCGTFHMEYEYAHNPEYKYLRQAIQIMNPANHNN